MKLKYIVLSITLVIVLFIISGCSKEPEFSCKSSYIEYQTGKCCLDSDSNGICDEDDVTLNNLKEDSADTDIPLGNLEAQAKITAEKFARAWESGDYKTMYDMFIPPLQELKSKENFVTTLDYYETGKDVTIRLDLVSLEDKNKAFAYYTASTLLFDGKIPAIEMRYINNEWKINSFLSYFIEEMGCKFGGEFECVLTQGDIDNCESQGVLYHISPLCQKNNCKIACNPGNFPSGLINLKVDIQYLGVEGIEIKNNDVDLTEVTLIFNGVYRKDIGQFNSGEEMSISRSEFINSYGRSLGDRQIESIYLYSQQGKLWIRIE